MPYYNKERSSTPQIFLDSSPLPPGVSFDHLGYTPTEKMHCFVNMALRDPEQIDQLYEHVPGGHYPLKRAAWLLNPGESYHFYTPHQLSLPADEDDTEWSGPYSQVNWQGGVRDALWAHAAGKEEAKGIATQHAKVGIDLLTEILDTEKSLIQEHVSHFKDDPYYGIPTSTRFRSMILQDPESRTILSLLRSLGVYTSEALDHKLISPQQGLHLTSAAIGTAHSMLYGRLYPHLLSRPETSLPKQRHLLYDHITHYTHIVAPHNQPVQEVHQWLDGSMYTASRLKRHDILSK